MLLFELELPAGSWALPEVELSPGTATTAGAAAARLTEPLPVIIHLPPSPW